LRDYEGVKPEFVYSQIEHLSTIVRVKFRIGVEDALIDRHHLVASASAPLGKLDLAFDLTR
jgi:hypothetical protein